MKKILNLLYVGALSFSLGGTASAMMQGDEEDAVAVAPLRPQATFVGNILSMTSREARAIPENTTFVVGDQAFRFTRATFAGEVGYDDQLQLTLSFTHLYNGSNLTYASCMLQDSPKWDEIERVLKGGRSGIIEVRAEKQ